MAWDFVIDDRNFKDLNVKKPNEVLLTDDMVKYLEEIKKSLPEDRWKAFMDNGPPMTNFRDLCKTLQDGGVSFEDSYLTLFRVSSSVAHGSDLQFYAQPGDNGITCQLSSSDENIDKIILTAAIFLRDICIQVHDLLNLNNTELKNRIVTSFETYKTLKVKDTRFNRH